MRERANELLEECATLEETFEGFAIDEEGVFLRNERDYFAMLLDDFCKTIGKQVDRSLEGLEPTPPRGEGIVLSVIVDGNRPGVLAHDDWKTVREILAGGIPTLQPVFLRYSAFESLIEGMKDAVGRGTFDKELRRDLQTVVREGMIQYKAPDRAPRQGRLRVLSPSSGEKPICSETPRSN